MSAPFTLRVSSDRTIEVTRGYGDIRSDTYYRPSEYSDEQFVAYAVDHEQRRHERFCALEAAIEARGVLEQHLGSAGPGDSPT